MPYVWEPAPVFHSFVRNQQKVHVYHVFKNDDANGCVREYHYGLSESVSDSDAFVGGISVDGAAFDLRDLPTWEDRQGQTVKGKQAIIDAAAAAGWFDKWLAANLADTKPAADEWALIRALCTSLRDFQRAFEPEFGGPIHDIARQHLAAAEAVVGPTTATPARVIRELGGDVRDEHEEE